MAIGRPEEKEFAPYYKGYVQQINSDDIMGYLKEDTAASLSFYKGITKDKWEYAYAEDKWTISQVLRHVIDTERVFAYRLVRIARGDSTPMAGFDQNLFIRNVEKDVSPQKLIEEYSIVRQSTLILMESIESKDWTNIGMASDNNVSTRALAYLIAGHESHHRQILKERYLS